MLKSKIKKWLARGKKGKTDLALSSTGSYIYRDIHNREIKDAELIMYPPKHEGIPVFSLEAIMERYGHYIHEIRKHSGVGSHRLAANGKSLFDEMYVNPIKRFATYAHMLPASDDWHHTEPGGLLVHSIETSIMALRLAGQKKDNQVASFGDIKRDAQERLLYAAWITALTHDTGKMLTDIEITALKAFDSDDTERDVEDIVLVIPVWHPEKESLIEWAAKHRVTRYDVTFVPTRIHREHNRKSAHLLPTFLYGEGLEYILDTEVDIHGAIIDSLNGYSERNDYLSRLVRQCDSESTRQDTERHHSRYKGAYATSVFSRAQKIIYIAHPHWVYNEPKGHVWCIGKTVFFRWPAVGDSLIETCNSTGIKLSKSTDFLYQLLLECSIVKMYGGTERGVNFAPGNYTKENILDIYKGNITPNWEYIVEVRDWTALTQGGALPVSVPGVLHMPRKNEYILITKKGSVTNFSKQDLDAGIESKTKPDAPHLTQLGTATANNADNKDTAKQTEESGTTGEAKATKKAPATEDVIATKKESSTGKIKSSMEAFDLIKDALNYNEDTGADTESAGDETTSTKPKGKQPEEVATKASHNTEQREISPAHNIKLKPIMIKTQTSNWGYDAQALALELGVDTPVEAASILTDAGVPILEVRNKPGVMIEVSNVQGKTKLVINLDDKYAQAQLHTENHPRTPVTKPALDKQAPRGGEKKDGTKAPAEQGLTTNNESQTNPVTEAPAANEGEEITPETEAAKPDLKSSSSGSALSSDSELGSRGGWTEADLTTTEGIYLTLKHHCKNAPHQSFAFYVNLVLSEDMANQAVVFDVEKKAVGLSQVDFSRTLISKGLTTHRTQTPQLATRVFEDYEDSEGTDWWYSDGAIYVPLQKIREIHIGGYNG